jgi:hypothetical protein
MEGERRAYSFLFIGRIPPFPTPLRDSLCPIVFILILPLLVTSQRQEGIKNKKGEEEYGGGDSYGYVVFYKVKEDITLYI